MTEYIERVAAIEACCGGCNPAMCSYDCDEVAAIRAIPAADVAPVVRCRDCKKATPWYADHFRCFLWSEGGIGVWEDGFCNYGVRRENNDT